MPTNEMDAGVDMEKKLPQDAQAKSFISERGYAEELRRDFSIWSLGSLCICLMATWEALGSVVAAALTNGGAPCLFYN